MNATPKTDTIDVQEVQPTTALTTRQESRPATVDELVGQVTLIQNVMAKVMIPDVHYGKVPGCGDKPTLLKPGAEKLMLTFRLAPAFQETVIDLPDGHREYRVKCTITAINNGQFIGQGVGSCSTMESKYRYRTEKTDKLVPQEYWKARDRNLLGGPTYEAKKSDGQWIVVHKVAYDNPADYWNTCLKIAKKRAVVDATITCTAASDIFAQDLDDLADNGVIDTETPPAATARKSKPLPADKVPKAAVDNRVRDFLANANKAGHMQVWAYCVSQGCLPKNMNTPLEKINPAAVPDWEEVAADLALYDFVSPELKAQYESIYAKDSLPGLEHPSDRTAKEDNAPKPDEGGASYGKHEWGPLLAPFGKVADTRLDAISVKMLWFFVVKWAGEPLTAREFNGKTYEPKENEKQVWHVLNGWRSKIMEHYSFKDK